jgi:hypothetical protein
VAAKLAGMVAALIARKGAAALWRVIAGRHPPEHPEAPEVAWPEAAGWVAASAAAVAVARLAAKRRYEE